MYGVRICYDIYLLLVICISLNIASYNDPLGNGNSDNIKFNIYKATKMTEDLMLDPVEEKRPLTCGCRRCGNALKCPVTFSS